MSGATWRHCRTIREATDWMQMHTLTGIVPVQLLSVKNKQASLKDRNIRYRQILVK